MWNNKIYNAGIVPPNTMIRAKFLFGGIAENLIFNLSCGCASGSWDPINQIFKLDINVGKIPSHITEYVLEKFATVSYTENKESKVDVLIVRGTVK